ncbi:MAG: hypothetical protein KGZ92_09735 [Firmicutes bacterium]|nr:hypothetical protein [Dethiobacter sp.]MBS3889543.1 hypothetical protein [Bacillota bacterium]MBS4053595.1 hypothetical protein [Thermaerobacter sp.]
MTKNKNQKNSKSNSALATEKNKQSTGVQSLGDKLLTWSVFPLWQDARRGRTFLFTVMAFLSFIYLIYGEMLWVAFGLAVILVSFHSFVLPSEYQLTTKGVTIRTGLFTFYRPWEDFKSALKFPDGILLNFSYRGLRRLLVPGQFIYYSKDNKLAVVAIIEKQMALTAKTADSKP